MSPVTAPSVPGGIPENVTYLIVGAGTAAFAAYRSIRANDPKAQVFLLHFSTPPSLIQDTALINSLRNVNLNVLIVQI